MKMKSIILAAVISALGFSSAQANEPTAAENYAMFCGSRNELISFLKSQGQDTDAITEAELLDLNQGRMAMIRILKNGNSAIQELIAEGSKADTGAFGAIMACGVLVELKNDVLKKGCYDLSTNKPVKNKNGIEACEVLLAKIKDRK
jgi:hypothetical protein